MAFTKGTKPDDPRSEADRRTLLRYAALTLILFIPLLIVFGAVRDVYPFAASRMMLGIKDTPAGREYYVLRGETVSGQAIDLPPINLTNALTGRSWSLVEAAVETKSFRIRFPHPANASLATAYGGIDKLPRAARLNDLLQTWGAIYNSRLPPLSNQKLKFVRLDAYRWDGGINGEYYRFVESWKVVL